MSTAGNNGKKVENVGDAHFAGYAWRTPQVVVYMLTGVLPELPRARMRKMQFDLVVELYSGLT